MRQALHLLVHHPGLAARIGECGSAATRIAELEEPGIPLLVAVLDLLEESPDLTTGSILEHFREDPLGRHLSRLAASPAPVLESLPNAGGEGLETELRGILGRLEGAVRAQRYDALARKAGPLDEAEKAELRLLLKEGMGAR